MTDDPAEGAMGYPFQRGLRSMTDQPIPRQSPCVHPARTPVPRASTPDRLVEDCQICGQRLSTDTRTGRTSQEITGR